VVRPRARGAFYARSADSGEGRDDARDDRHANGEDELGDDFVIGETVANP